MFRLRPLLVRAAVLAAGCTAFTPPLLAQVSFRIDATRADQSPLEHVLASRASLSFGQMSIEGLAELLRQQFSINVLLDRRALDDVGVPPDRATLAPVHLSQVVLEEALGSVLREYDLDFVTRDEVLVITTPEEAENELQTRVYPVADLVFVGRSIDDHGNPCYDDYDTLIDTITSTIAPDSWDEVGGAGAIESFPPSRSLVISQTREVQRQVGPLLETLRRAKAVSHSWVVGHHATSRAVGSRPYVPRGEIPSRGNGAGSPRYLYRPRQTLARVW
jgi:hypothetical protein